MSENKNLKFMAEVLDYNIVQMYLRKVVKYVKTIISVCLKLYFRQGNRIITKSSCEHQVRAHSPGKDDN